MAPSADPSDADLARLVVRALAALVAFLFCIGIAVVVTRIETDTTGRSENGAVTDAPSGGGGPSPGADVTSYVADRRAAHNDRQRATAIVSFSRYHVETEARSGVNGLHVDALLVAAPGGLPSVVAGSVDAWARKQRADAGEERTALQTMLAGTTDAEFAAQYRADIVRLTATIAAIDGHVPLVFGAVVRASGEELTTLGSRDGIRLVDVLGMPPPALADVRGLRPEETNTAGVPPERPT